MSDSPIGLDVAACLFDNNAGREAFVQLKRECGRAVAVRREVEHMVQELHSKEEPPAGLSKSRAKVRLGIGWWILSDPEKAISVLDEATSSAERDYFLAISCLESERPRKAIELLDRLADQVDDGLDVALSLVWAKTDAGCLDDAQADLDKLAGDAEREPEYHYRKGYYLEHIGQSEEAVAEFEKALSLDPDHAGSTFRLAAHYAFIDETDKALEYYEKLKSAEPFYPSSMINLGVLYEDLGKVDKAIECYKAVLAREPLNWRASLYLKDAEASLSMYYDEDTARRTSHKWELLRAPISDFELTVRSRNCLAKMNIHTLGDLVSKPEEELLSYQNFGETSLLEIKQLLMEKGLSLGQDFIDVGRPSVLAEKLAVTDTSYQEDILRCPVTELKLSVRCQACMDRLGIVTIQDLVSKSIEELSAARNFGKVSLREIQEKLAEHGLKLKGEE